MTHTYQITGMTCPHCEAKVKSSLLSLPDVTSAKVNAVKNEATISMDKHITINELQKALDTADGDYKISANGHSEVVEQTKSWFETYKPILVIFAYITGITLLLQLNNDEFDFMQWMQHFMAGFFLVFSFFKLLDLSAFAESYSIYDIIARRAPAWSYIYAFIELGLGIGFLVNFNPFVTSIAAFAVMSVSITGVLQTVLNKRKIQCACLGAVFNLPMSMVTIIEDALMIVMSGAMIVMYL